MPANYLQQIKSVMYHKVASVTEPYKARMANVVNVPVTESRYITYTPDESASAPHLAITEDFYNCVGLHLVAKKPGMPTSELLLHYNEPENSNEQLRESLDRFKTLLKQGYTVKPRIIINALCASDQTGMVTRDKQIIARETVLNTVKAELCMPCAVDFTSESHFIIDRREERLQHKSKSIELLIRALGDEIEESPYSGQRPIVGEFTKNLTLECSDKGNCIKKE